MEFFNFSSFPVTKCNRQTEDHLAMVALLLAFQIFAISQVIGGTVNKQANVKNSPYISRKQYLHTFLGTSAKQWKTRGGLMKKIKNLKNKLEIPNKRHRGRQNANKQTLSHEEGKIGNFARKINVPKEF